MKKSIQIEHENIFLQGIYKKGTTGKAAVITHPHPLYGGNMDNPVVTTLDETFQEKGYSTLRFNFRGVGKSQGFFDNGIGEQEDVIASISFLRKQGYGDISVAGYSFGSWVNAHALSGEPHITKHIMISPPVAMMCFDDVSSLECPTLIVSGSNDAIAPLQKLKNQAAGWKNQPRIQIVNGCDHFFSNCLEKLKSCIVNFI